MGANISQLERDIGQDQFPNGEHYFGLVNVCVDFASVSARQLMHFHFPILAVR